MKHIELVVTRATALSLALVVLCVVTATSPAMAEPELVESTPLDGSVLEAPPETVRLCFSEPVQTEEDDWRMTMRAPGGQVPGLRIVFADDGTCVTVFPGRVSEPSEGIWSLDWLVHAQSDESEKSGVVRLQVGELQPGDTPLPTPQQPRQTTESDDDGAPTALVALAAVGAVIVVLASLAFVIRRRTRRRGEGSV
jgi:methionine-rich copper-binding protein CopC